MLTDFIPLVNEMPVIGKVAVSLLAGSILVARSPSSAIAIIKELRAKGPFTQTALGVTVIMDAVVIVDFALNSSLADVLLNNIGMNLGFVLLLAVELAISIALGLVVGKILEFAASRRWNIGATTAFVLLIGYAVSHRPILSATTWR